MGGGSKADRREPSRNPLSAAPDRKPANTFQHGKPKSRSDLLGKPSTPTGSPIAASLAAPQSLRQ